MIAPKSFAALVISRMLWALPDDLLGSMMVPPKTAEQVAATRAARTLAHRAVQVKAVARRQAIAAHVSTFGPFARGLDILKENPAND